ncbi:hypothetical protein J6590_068471 [Homalodisca vitripennis]|nr:hypothetical protein J6590_068471 [Homalodisca vitripennis]
MFFSVECERVVSPYIHRPRGLQAGGPMLLGVERESLLYLGCHFQRVSTYLPTNLQAEFLHGLDVSDVGTVRRPVLQTDVDSSSLEPIFASVKFQTLHQTEGEMALNAIFTANQTFPP